MTKNTNSEKKRKKWTKKKTIVLTGLVGLGLLSLSALATIKETNSNSSNPLVSLSVNTDNAINGYAKNNNQAFSLNTIANDALISSSGRNAWLTTKTNQLILNWFKNSKNKSIERMYANAKQKAESQYNSNVATYKKTYGNNWEYYVQNNLLDPIGGSETDYINSQIASTLRSDFQTLIFGGQFGLQSFLGFHKITNNGKLLPFDQWSNPTALINAKFINNPINWAGNDSSTNNNQTSLGFFPSQYLNLPSDKEALDLHLANFDQYLFDQWMIHENPFIASSILYEYWTKNNSTTLNGSSQSIYNSNYFKNLPQSNNLDFPMFGSIANNQFDNHLYEYLQPSSETNPNGYVDNNGFYINTNINSWNDANTSVYNDQGYTGGFNFFDLGNVGSTQTGYFVTNGANISGQQYYSYNTYLPSYSMAAINRYNVLMFDQNKFNAIPNGIGGTIYNGFNSTYLNKNILANFLFSNATGNNSENGTFTPGFINNNIPQSFNVINPRYTYLLYNGSPLSSTTLSQFWNTSFLNQFQNDKLTTLSFNVLYNNKQLSPYIFTRDGDGVHVIAIDGYDRIIAAEQNPASIASPIDVYPNPTNSYEAAVDAIAQDILWRQEQLNAGIQTKISINLFTTLTSYFQANENQLILGYAQQVLKNKTSNNYNPLFSNGYNLFSTNDVSSVFDTNNNQTATLNLMNILIQMQDYLIEQKNENTLKNQLLVNYTGNNGTSSSASSTYGIGSNFNLNGIKPAIPYFADLKSSILYPYLSLYIYHLSFSNTLGFNDVANHAGNIWTTNQTNKDYLSSLLTLDQQLNSLNTSFKKAVNTYVNSLSLQPFAYQEHTYAKYAQYVLTNNVAINDAINSSTTNLANDIKNTLLANALKINLNNNPTISNDLGLTNSTINNIFPGTDKNYGTLSYLATALIYENDLSSFTKNLYSTINYGSNYNLDPSTYFPTSTNYKKDIVNLTNHIFNYYNDENYQYAELGLDPNDTFNNSYLTLLETINYLYDNGTWINLWNYLNNIVANGPAYVVWVNGDSANYLNNMNLPTSSSSNTNNINLANTGQIQQYADSLNSAINQSYNTKKVNFGVTGYTNINNVFDYGYGPFNYIPNANLDGDMINQFIDQNIAATATGNSASNQAYNNISTYNFNASSYFNLANININGTEEPFTGFIGLQTQLSHSQLTNLQLNSYLFSDAQYSINGAGLLANYYQLGNNPGTNQPQPSGPSLMSSILNASSLSELITISSQLQNVSSNFPGFSNQYIGNNKTQTEINKSYAEAVYKAISSIPNYQSFFHNFSGYVTGFQNTPSSGENYFKNIADLYSVLSGGKELKYNNLYSSWNSYNSLLQDKISNNSANLYVVNALGQERLIPYGSGQYISLNTPNASTSNNSSLNYKFMMYATQISQQSLGQKVWNTNTPWKSLNLSEDAFAKLVVQIAQNSTLQSSAISAFTNNKQQENKVNVYDIRLRNTLGILWILNWIIG